MKYFFGFDTKLAQEIDYMFTADHMFLLLVGAAIIVALYFALHAKSERGIKITKIVLASTLLLVQIMRTTYNALSHLNNNPTLAGFNWWWSLPFQMCGIMVMLAIVILYCSAFIKNKGTTFQVFYNIMFSVGLVGGFLSFVYPDMISADRSLTHWSNVQTIVVHLLLIFIPIYLIKIGELKIRLRNVWMTIIGYVGGGILAMTVSQISGQNFAFSLKTGLLNDIGINIPFPWHYPVTLAIVFVVPLIIYSVFELVHYLKNRGKVKEEKRAVTDKKAYILSLVCFIGGTLVATILCLTIPLMFSVSPVKSWVAIVIILAELPLIAGMWFGYYFQKKAYIA